MCFLNRFKNLFSKLFHDESSQEIVDKERFIKRSQGKAPNDFIEDKMQAMKDSQGKSDFSGSSYNGPGNVDHEKTNSNMSQRNF